MGFLHFLFILLYSSKVSGHKWRVSLTPQKRKSTILQLHDDPVQHRQHGSDIQEHQDDWLTEEADRSMHVMQSDTAQYIQNA